MESESQTIRATTPVADAARHVLTLRLEAVRDSLPLVLQQSDHDPEHVHQLRVGTRRARAALDIFCCCLPAKTYKKAKKTLRNIRQVAGEARDWDVFLESLTRNEPAQKGKSQSGKPSAAIYTLIGYAIAKREAAQVLFDAAGKDYPFAFERFLAESIAEIRKPADNHVRNLFDLALPRLTSLVKQLETAAGGDLNDFGNRLANWLSQGLRKTRYPNH